MLVLSRKDGETIALEFGGCTVYVTPVRTQRGLVRIGFEAPPEVIIKRAELLDEPWARELPTALEAVT